SRPGGKCSAAFGRRSLLGGPDRLFVPFRTTRLATFFDVRLMIRTSPYTAWALTLPSRAGLCGPQGG
ncbi:MAG TPA: hypothetical protein VI256_03310, partial [Roseiarcus sp.]